MPLRKEIDPRIATLVRVIDNLRKMNKPNAHYYSASPEMRDRDTKRRDELAQELGLSDRQILGWKGLMVREGYPFWRTGSSDSSVYAPAVTNNGSHPNLGREIKPGEIIEVRTLVETSA